MMENARGHGRLFPHWWDHQRHVNHALASAVRRILRWKADAICGRRIIDLGCGDCPYQPLFVESGCSAYVRCDLAGDVDVLLRPGERCDLPESSAHVVVSFQVLEHVWDVEWYLGEAWRLLTPGGILILSTHGTWLYHPHPTDYRRWTRDGLLEELRSRRFDIERVDALVGPLAWTTQFRLLGIREALLRLPVLGPLLLLPIAIAMNLRMSIEDALTPSWIRDSNACIYAVVARKA